MLIKQNLLTLVRLNLAVLHILGPYPYQFDKKSNKIIFSSSAGLQKENRKILAQLLFAVLVSLQLVRFKNKFTIGVIYVALLYVIVPIGISITVYAYFNKNQSNVNFFNMLLTFEQNLIKGTKLELYSI